jgi:hypothetical protein
VGGEGAGEHSAGGLEHGGFGGSGVEEAHVAQDEHGVGAPGESKRVLDLIDIVIGELAAQGLDDALELFAAAALAHRDAFGLVVGGLVEPAVEAGLDPQPEWQFVVEHQPSQSGDDRVEALAYVVATFRVLHVFEFRDGLISRENVWLDGAAIAAPLATAP